MKKSASVIINLGKGDLTQGFLSVTAQIYVDSSMPPQQITASLPPAVDLRELRQQWQSLYRALCARLSVNSRLYQEEEDEWEIEDEGINQVSQGAFGDVSEQLTQTLNKWLQSEEFNKIDAQLRLQLTPDDPVNIIIETPDPEVTALPWHRWHLLKDFKQAEVALGQTEYKLPLQPSLTRQKVRILAILGNTQGIDVEQERQFLQGLPNAETVFLAQPSRQQLDHYLWHPQGWDILFFAGHSQSEGKTGRLYLNNQPKHNNLTIDQLEEALKAAIDKGLKLAIFNSCDGLGLANALSQLNIPHVIVMGEPVPNKVAEVFFQHFLTAFALERLSLPLAVRQARRKLQALEDDYVAASWLPVLFQNPAVSPPTWLQLGGIPPCPYKGLFSFQEEDAAVFFGRDRLSNELSREVQQRSLVAIVGSSGSGKSSLVFAGVIPKLRQHSSLNWEILSIRPTYSPFDALAEALSPFFPQDKITLKQILEQNPLSLSQYLSQIMRSSWRLLLVIDQFEELYTLVSESERQLFLDAILHGSQDTVGLTIIITLRADFYGHALQYRPLSDALQGSVYNLSPMTQTELQEAIEKPANLMGVTLAEGLTEKLMTSWQNNPESLPLLEFTLTQLWSKQADGQLTHEAYHAIGGVATALANHAEGVYGDLSPGDRLRMEKIMIQLVKLGDGTESTRRIATISEIKPENWDLVTHLANARLLVTRQDPHQQIKTVELIHETLIRSWGRLGQWLQRDGEFRRWQEQLRIRQREWQQSGYDLGGLLRGKFLEDAKYWLEKHPDDLSQDDEELIAQSIKQQKRELKQQKKQKQVKKIAILGIMLISLLFSSLLFWQWQKSIKQEVKAINHSARLLSASHQEFDALLTSLQAGRKLKRWVWFPSSNLKQEVITGLQESVYGVREKNRLIGHKGAVYNLDFSPDGQLLASAGADHLIKLWGSNGELKHTLKGHEGEVYDVSFSLNGNWLASASADQTVQLWNLEGKQLKTLYPQQGEVYAVNFSPDGQILASAGEDSTIKLWKPDGTLIKTLVGHQGKVYDVIFSLDGQFLASASEDRTIKLWKPDGTLIKTIEGYQGSVLSVSFSHDSQILAGTSEDGTIRYFNQKGELLKTLNEGGVVHRIAFTPDNCAFVSVGGDTMVKMWNLDGTMLQTFYGHQDGVYGVAVSPNNRMIASASADGTIKLWQRESEWITTLQQHHGDVSMAIFSPDNQLIASVSQDKTIKLWDREGNIRQSLTGHTDYVHGVAFSPDSQLLVTASWDHSLKLWSRDGKLQNTLTGHTDKVYDVAFSPDGQYIVSSSSDGTVKLWTRQGKLLKTLVGHQDVVHGVAFSPDGQYIASASHDRTVKLWNLQGELIKTFTGHTNWVHGIAFSPDGKMIASASHDRTVKLWNLQGELRQNITGHRDKVLGVRFSPDGNYLASSSHDQTIKIWTIKGQEIATLRGHGDAVHGINFSPDGRTLVSASYDNTLILWQLNKLENLNHLLEQGEKWLEDYHASRK